ncbi:MAG TPA: alpha-2-macroglobulin family protein, partial [Kofleriaceae bacterium]|nr:alpha-2-macroglobulin family protein [Kofleriaceae bacterium]
MPMGTGAVALAEGAPLPRPGNAMPRRRAADLHRMAKAAPPPPAAEAVKDDAVRKDAEAPRVAPMAGGIAQRDIRAGCCFGAAVDAKNAGRTAVREFPVPNYKPDYDGPRSDFRETIYWNPSVKTDGGKAKVTFFASDAVTSFRAVAEGVSAGGMPGRGDTLVESVLPVSLAVKLPLEVSAGDTIDLPITIANNTGRTQTAAFAARFGSAFKLKNQPPATVRLGAGEKKTVRATLSVIGNGKDPEAGQVEIFVRAGHLKDEVKKTLRVVPLGFPQKAEASGTLANVARHEIDLAGALPGTITASINLYPSPLSTMIKGTEAMIREPYGCFEQASSANYPNIMILSYLEEHKAADPALVAKTMTVLDHGYQKIAGYESPKHGYEWFGGDPGHEALTAYGLMEFHDMAAVYGGVNAPMVQRTQQWLLSRRDGHGGFLRNSRALDSFGRAGEAVTNGYIAYALAETGTKSLAPELAAQKRAAKTTKDPYVMALAANVLVDLEPKASTTAAAIARLAKMQSEDGSFSGAAESITKSGGVALNIETTSLAAMAMLKAGTEGDAVRRAVSWIHDHQNGAGGYGSTQSTVLALKALAQYAEASRRTRAGGTVSLRVNGKRAGRITFKKGDAGPLTFDNLARYLRPGKNVIELSLESSTELPYSVGVTYRSARPATSPAAKVAITTSLAKSTVPVGESVRMNVAIKNVTDAGIPMVLARVGLPGGLTFQTWQLKELREKHLIDFYETREREVILYLRSMAPGAEKAIPLELVARVPGHYVGPASRAYLYYTDEDKHWAPPATITVER